MAVDHYENFPVASFILPAPLRRPVALIYRFARTADDIADEGNASAAARLQQLEELREELRRLQDGAKPAKPWFDELGSVIREFRLPFELFFDLLSAFSQDVVQNRYDTFASLLDYCRRSANPVGRLLLALYGAVTPENNRYADSICSALQLVNFLQDVAVDYAKGRIYIPADEMAHYGVTVEHVASGQGGDAWRALMAFQVSRARSMLLSGEPLGRRLPGRVGLETRLIIRGGNRILGKIEDVEGDVFGRRPVLRWFDWPVMLVQAV